MRYLIVANGELPAIDKLSKAIADADFVLAVDGGANGLHELGLTADAVIGDFDSIAVDSLRGVLRIPAVDQDYTDLDKAVRYCVDAGASTVVMTGVTGNRLDHTYGALSVLVKYGRSVDLALLDDIGVGVLVVNRVQLDVHPRQTVSLIPLGLVTGIVTSGLKWPLVGESLEPGVRDGISNEATSDVVSVTVASGNLVVYVHHAS